MGMKIVWNRSIGWNIDMHRYKKNKMKYTIITNGADCYPWREVFVWWPWVTTITGKRIWWKKAYKRRVWMMWGAGFHMEPEVQYATLGELLMDADQIYETI